MAQGSVASPPERGPLDDNTRDAIESSHLRSLVPEVLAELTQGATRLRVPAGRNVYREGDVPAHFNIVVSGLLRVYVTALDGRTMTVRYGRPGAALGVVSLFTRAGELPASVQALTDADLLVLQPSLVRRAAERDVRVARAMIDELSERVRCFIAEMASCERNVTGSSCSIRKGSWASRTALASRRTLASSGTEVPDRGHLVGRHCDPYAAAMALRA